MWFLYHFLCWLVIKERSHTLRGAGRSDCCQHTEYGWTNPILIDENNVVIAGHVELLRPLSWGWMMFPALFWKANGESEEGISSGRQPYSAESGWDEELLSAELADLAADDFLWTQLVLLSANWITYWVRRSRWHRGYGYPIWEGWGQIRRKVQYLSFGGHKIPATDEEADVLTARCLVMLMIMAAISDLYRIAGWGGVLMLHLNYDITHHAARNITRVLSVRMILRGWRKRQGAGACEAIDSARRFAGGGHQRTKALRKLGITRAAVYGCPVKRRYTTKYGLTNCITEGFW